MIALYKYKYLVPDKLVIQEYCVIVYLYNSSCQKFYKNLEIYWINEI